MSVQPGTTLNQDLVFAATDAFQQTLQCPCLQTSLRWTLQTVSIGYETFLFDSASPPPPNSSEIRRPDDELSFGSRHWADFDLDSEDLGAFEVTEVNCMLEAIQDLLPIPLLLNLFFMLYRVPIVACDEAE